MAMKKILACMTRADVDYNLIENGDRIAVGVSGGKDSMLLIKALKQYQMFARKDFSFYAVFLDLGFGNVDIETLKKYCDELNVPLHIENSTDVYLILKEHKNASGHLPCSICSRMKKASINKVAHELNCNKVAFAHHMEDALETLLMNTIYGGRIATFAPKMHLTNTDLIFIRPFILTREKEISATCKNDQIPIIKSACPNDHKTMREEAKQMLQYIYQKYPCAYNNFTNMLQDDTHFDLWYEKKEFPLKDGFTIKKCISQKDFFNVVLIRSKVFCEEQNCSATEEFENIDQNENTIHFLLSYKEKPIGTLSYTHIKDKDFRLRRFAILKEYRHKKIGKEMIRFVECYIAARSNPCNIIIHGQKSLENYYNSLGYERIGEDFIESNIVHCPLSKTIKNVIKYKAK